ncbi:MAG TPA: ABC transporter substrate-binding protein [Micropepsaceae bacterium]|nr:ABC transporter substrate-binding protein [Micropepsaceae bacterium]
MFRFPIALAVLLMLAPALRAADAADPAAHQVETFYAALVDTMKQGSQLGLQGRYHQLTPIVRETFDLPVMAQLSVGPAWQKLNDRDHKAITDAFERMTISNYAANFATYGGEKFTVDPMVKMRNTDKIVESKLTTDKETVPFNYRMHLADGKWKVVDVYLNGYVSQLAVRRADFASTIASSGAAGLVKKINDLVDKQMAGG